MISLIKKLPIQLFLCVLVGIVFGATINNQLVRLFYTISVFLKEGLMFFLPFIIFSYLFSAVLSFKKHALLMILSLVPLIMLSNSATVLTSYGVAHLVFPLLGEMSVGKILSTKESIEPFFQPSFGFLSANHAMIMAISLGVLSNYFSKGDLSEKFSETLKKGITAFLTKLFIPLLPFYVFGFVLKLAKEDILVLLLQSYGKIFILSCSLIISYLSFIYLVAARFRFSTFISYLKVMLPPWVTSFTTMSSLAAMPLTIKATEKILKNKKYAHFIIPATANFHLVGDGLNLSLTSLALLAIKGFSLPSFYDYTIFTFFYCIAKFSCAAVPGAGVLVILPVVSSYLGLDAESVSFLTAIYILQDPILTSANVMGNGAFAILTERFFSIKQEEPSTLNEGSDS